MERKNPSIYDKVTRLKTAPVIFIHIDTTGLGVEDEIVRLSIVADDSLVYDEIYYTERAMNEQAARVSGISPQSILESTVCFEDEVWSLKEMLSDKLLICVNDNFTKKFLSKADLELDDKNLIDLTKATDFFASGTIKTASDMLQFYGYESNAGKTTFDRNFIYYDCACKLQYMTSALLKR